MASLAQTSATTTLSISSTLPATYDAIGFQNLTWTPIGEISSMGVYGAKTTVVKHIPVDTATVVKRAGSTDSGTMNLSLARHAGTDVTKLIAANNSRASIAVKIAMPSLIGGADYFTAIVTSYQTSVGTADQILMSSVDLEIDNAIIYT